MSLTRKDLNEIGVPEEFHSLIIAKHRDTVDEIKDERDRYKAEAEKVPALESERDSWKSKAEDGTAAARIEELEKQVSGFEAEKLNGIKRTALTELMKSINMDEKVIPLAIDASNLDDVELDGETVKNADALAETYKSKYANFIQTVGSTGKPPLTPPQNKPAAYTPEDIRKMSASEINKNFDAIKASLKGE